MPIPEGFVLHDRTSPVTAPWAPIYVRHESDRVRLCIEVRAAHTNSRGLLHGGVIAALVDNAMGLSLGKFLAAEGRECEKGAVTTSLSIDYLKMAKLGQLLEVDTSFIRAGRSQGVTQAFVLADAEVIARANATFRFS